MTPPVVNILLHFALKTHTSEPSRIGITQYYCSGVMILLYGECSNQSNLSEMV